MAGEKRRVGGEWLMAATDRSEPRVGGGETPSSVLLATDGSPMRRWRRARRSRSRKGRVRSFMSCMSGTRSVHPTTRASSSTSWKLGTRGPGGRGALCGGDRRACRRVPPRGGSDGQRDPGGQGEHRGRRHRRGQQWFWGGKKRDHGQRFDGDRPSRSLPGTGGPRRGKGFSSAKRTGVSERSTK